MSIRPSTSNGRPHKSNAATELLQPEGWFFMSFANATRFLGACIVQGRGPISAARKARELGCHPGGEIMCTRIPRNDYHRVPIDMRNRSLTKEEIHSRLDGRGVNE